MGERSVSAAVDVWGEILMSACVAHRVDDGGPQIGRVHFLDVIRDGIKSDEFSRFVICHLNDVVAVFRFDDIGDLPCFCFEGRLGKGLGHFPLSMKIADVPPLAISIHSQSVVVPARRNRFPRRVASALAEFSMCQGFFRGRGCWRKLGQDVACPDLRTIKRRFVRLEITSQILIGLLFLHMGQPLKEIGDFLTHLLLSNLVFREKRLERRPLLSDGRLELTDVVFHRLRIGSDPLLIKELLEKNVVDEDIQYVRSIHFAFGHP